MKNWEQTKRLLLNEDPIFIYARVGDLAGVKSSLNVLNIDKKDSKGYTPLMLAAMQGHMEIVELLISLSADVNARDNNGNTVLMGATFTGKLTVVKLLLEHGADPYACNYKRQTALLFARHFGLHEIERLLVRVS